jgi:hypothetical protein
MASTRWTKAEIELLDQLIDNFVIDDIVKKLQAFQRKNGLPVRSFVAVRKRLFRTKQSQKATLNNFSREQLARTLGVKPERARRWQRYFDMPIKKTSRINCIQIPAFKRWAYANPDCLAGVEADRLNWIMDDIEFCEMVESRVPPRIGRKTPVVRVSDGQVFPTMNAAAKAAFLDRTCIRRRLGTEYKFLHEWQSKAPARYSKSA